MFLDMLLLSRVECGMKRKLHYYFITSLFPVYMQYTNMLNVKLNVNGCLCIDNAGIVL